MNNPQPNTTVNSLQKQRQTNWIFAGLALFFIGFYLFNISGWLIDDDEGTDLYEAWQLQLGHQPGVDFIAEQQPLFLLIGKTGFNLTDNSIDSVTIVRIFSAVQVLAGSIFFGLVVRRQWGNHVATLTIGVMLTSGLIYDQARLFRPDPMMFAWELFGLGFVLLAMETGKRPYWGLAGATYGVAVLMKLFGIFPVIGLALYFLYLFFKKPREWQTHLLNGITFTVPFLLISGGVSLILYSQMGFYYQEVFNQHLSLGQHRTFSDQLVITIGTYLAFVAINSVIIFIVPLAIINRRSGEVVTRQLEKALLRTQLLVPFFFVLITRPQFTRYYIFLLPIFALLLALQMQGFFNKIGKNHPNFNLIAGLSILLLISFSMFLTSPSIRRLLTQKESDTVALAEFIQAHTKPDDVVVSDYASMNFHANRPSIYEASIIAGGRIDGGIITGALLIARMEASKAKLVLLHVEGGRPLPDHLIKLIDFPVFEAYLAEKYELLEVFDRAGQIIEIYERR